jgi:hypothetical protein
MTPLEVEFTLHPLRPDQPVMRITCGVHCSLVEIGQDKTGRDILAAINDAVQSQRLVTAPVEGRA